MLSSDADSDVLADYVLALLRHDQGEEEVKNLCVEQLDDFLRERMFRNFPIFFFLLVCWYKLASVILPSRGNILTNYRSTQTPETLLMMCLLLYARKVS